MTTLREAALMALEALRVATTPRSEDRQTVLKAQAALREALATCKESLPVDLLSESEREIKRLRAELFEALCKRHVEAEPVAYGYRDARGNIRLLNHYETKMDRIPLYTSPPQRQPLTDEEIDALAIDEDGLPNSHFEFARAIERAHGIGSQE